MGGASGYINGRFAAASHISSKEASEECTSARPGTQYSFHISGNRGYDSNQVRSLSIFHSYFVEEACMGTSTITPCYEVERLKTKTHVGVRPRVVKRIHQAQAES